MNDNFEGQRTFTPPCAYRNLNSGKELNEMNDSTAAHTDLLKRPLTGFSLPEMRLLQQLLELEKYDYTPDESFVLPKAEKTIFNASEDLPEIDASWYRPLLDSLTTHAREEHTGKHLVLTAAQERVIFLRFNYCRFRVAELLGTLNGRRPTPAKARKILDWNARAMQLRHEIAEVNVALVMAMAKRTRAEDMEFADMLGEGNMALLRAVDKFDVSRGFKFSTYACRAILKAFGRQGMKQTKYRQHNPVHFDPEMERVNPNDLRDQTERSDGSAEVRTIMVQNLARLSPLEREVIHYRFGLDAPRGSRPLTLEQVGSRIGVTKERVRQVQKAAIAKLKWYIEHDSSEGFDTEAVLA